MTDAIDYDKIVSDAVPGVEPPQPDIPVTAPGATGPSPVDYDKLVGGTIEQQTRQQFLETLRNSKDVIPERQARAIETARLRGVPVGVAYKYLDELAPKPDAPDYDSMTHKAPATARLLADPVKGPVAFPDAKPLGDIEQSLKGFLKSREVQGPPAPPKPWLSLREQVYGIGSEVLTPEQQAAEQMRILKQRADELKAIMAHEQQIAAERQAREAIDPMFKRDFGGANYNENMDLQLNADKKASTETANKFANAFFNKPTLTDVGAMFDAFGAGVGAANIPGYAGSLFDWVKTLADPDAPDAGQGNFATRWGDAWSKGVAELFPGDKVKADQLNVQFVGAVGTMLPIIAAAWGSGGTTALMGGTAAEISATGATSAALMGSASQVESAKQEMKQFNLSPMQKAIYGLGNAAIGLLDVIPAERLLGLAEKTAGRGFSRFLAGVIKQAAVEGPTEGGQQLLQDTLAKYLFDPARDVWGNAGSAFVVGGLAGGFFGATAMIANSAAEANHQRLLALGEAARKVRLADLSRQIFDEHIAGMKEAGEIPAAVTAPVKAVLTLFQELTTDQILEQFPSTARALQEARQHQGPDEKSADVEVTIPAEELARLGKLKGYNNFTADVRVGDDLTFNEKMDATKKIIEDLGKLDTSVPSQEDSTIYQDLRNQLIKAGQSPEVATAQARLMDAFFTTQSERTGVPAADLARRYGLEVSNSAMAEAGGQTTLAQESAAPTFGEPAIKIGDQIFKASDYFPNWPKGDRPAAGRGGMSIAEEQATAGEEDLGPGMPEDPYYGHVDLLGEARKTLGADTVDQQLEQSPGRVAGFVNAAGEFQPLDRLDSQGKLKATTLNQSVAVDPASEQFLTSLNDREQALVNPIYSNKVPPKKLKSNEAAARWLEKFFTGTPITDFTAEIPDVVLREIGNVMAAEAIHAMQKSGNAYDWYSEAMQRALGIAAIKWPMLGTDAAAAEAGFGTAENARFVFTYIMAVTSQNLDVAANATATNKAFDEMILRVKAGDFTMSRAWGTGDKQAAMGENFAKFGPLIDAMPGETFPEKLTRLDNLFRRKMPVSEWVREMKADGVPYNPPGQTAMDAVVYGSSLLGPKIGNGFWQNLNGNFTPLTIDLWMRRTWGRLTGKSIGNEAALPAQRKRLKASIERSINSPERDLDPLLSTILERRSNNAKIRALEARTDLTKKAQNAAIKKLTNRNTELDDIAADYRGIPAPEGWKAAYDTDNAALAAYAKRLLGAWNKEYKKLREKYGKKVPAKLQPTWARGAKRLKADLTTPLDQVANGTQRKQIEKAVGYAQQTLASLGHQVTTADLQAILWYPEKELWNALTSELAVDEDGDPVIPPSPLNESYDTVFARILNAEGFDTQQGAAGDAAGAGDVGALAGGPDAAARPDGSTDPVVPGPDVGAPGATQGQVDGGPQAGPSSSQETTLNQKGGPDVRGSITFTPLRDKFRITLTEKANLSTFIHEGGHFFLEVLQDLVERGEASAQQVADLKTLKRWMAIEDGKAIDRGGHEKFARTWEQFIMEGKAPSLALHGIFQKFKAWMIFVYKRLANVRGDLNDEIRSVMDRLVASDAAIAEARALVGWRGQPMTQEETGLTDAEYKAYVGEWTKANDAQSQDADARIMLEAARELKKTWAEEKTKVTKELEAELAATRGFKAWKLLQDGEGLEEFGRTQIKIDPTTVPKEWRADTRGMTADADQGGMDLDMVAELLGFDTGEQLLQSIGGARLAQRAIPARVRQVMVERHGEMDAASLSQEAMKAVHNTPTMDVLFTEFRALAAKANLKVGKDTKRLVAAAAAERVAKMTARQLEPGKWRRAEVKAAEEAGKMAAKGKDTEAALAKRKQLVAAAMVKASLDAQDRIEKMKDYLTTFTTNRRRAALGKAGQTYLDAVDQILEGVQLKDVTLKAIKARKSLDEIVKEAEANGEPVFVSDATKALLNRKNYTEMTLEELEGVHDAVKNLWTIAKEVTTVRKGAEKIALENALSEIEKEAEDLLPVKKQRDHLNPSKIDKMMAGIGRYHAGNLKIEFIVDWLGKTAHSLIYQPISNAAFESWKLHRDLTAPFMDKLRKMPKEQRARWNTKRQFLNYPIPMKGANIWAVALNLGNASNKEKLLAGYGWTEAEVMAELNTFMTKEDWDLVQETWDTIEKMWPKMSDVVRRATGLTPPKIEATEIVTPFGTYRGGYYPVVYDTKIDARMDDKLDSSISPEEMFSKRFTAFVINNGFTKGRTGNVGKLLFSPDVIADHLGEVIHYATHYDAVKQADKILRAPAFKALVKTHLGDAVYAEMKQWLKDVAANSTGTDRVTDSGSRTLRWLRNSAQLTSLGFNLLSALKQPLGMVNALDAVGPTYWAHGVQKALLSPNVVQNWKDAFAHSKELGPLLKNFDRDLAAISRAYADSVGDRAKTGAYVLAFTPLSVMQSIANVATWHGAYQQAVAQGMSEQDAYDAADKAIRQTQGSGSLKDLTGMQRGGEASKLFTMFYSYFSIVYNRLADIQTRERGAKNLHRKAMRYTILLLIPSLLNMLADDAWEDLFHPDRAEKRDETPFLVRLALETVSSTVAAFPVVREIYSGAEAVVTGKKPRSLPAVGVLEQLTRAGSAIKDITYDGDPLTRAKARSIVQGAGVVSNTPIYGIYRAIDDLFGAKIFDE